MKPFIWRRTRLRDAANFRNLHCLKICKLWFSISLSQNWTEWPITHSTWPLCRSGGKQIIRHVWVLLPTQRIDRGSVSTNQTPAAIGENRSSVWCIIHPYLTYSSNGGFVPHTWKLSVLHVLILTLCGNLYCCGAYDQWRHLNTTHTLI